MTFVYFNVKKEFWSLLIPENLPKMTFFGIELRKSPQHNIFSDPVKISQNDNYFLVNFFKKKKNNSCEAEKYKHLVYIKQKFASHFLPQK